MKRETRHMILTVAMALLLTLDSSPFSTLAMAATVQPSAQQEASDVGQDEEAEPSTDSDPAPASADDGTSLSVESGAPAQGANEPSVATEEAERDPETFDAGEHIKLGLTLMSDDTSKTYELSGDETVDTRADFPDGLSRSATYSAAITIDTRSMLEEQGKYPFVAGDKIVCRMPDVLRVGDSATTGRLHDSTAEWDGEHDGVGDYALSKDADGHNVLTITLDEGYVEEKGGKILSLSARISGSFDLEGKSTDGFDEDLPFGSLSAKVRFQGLKVVRNLSIEKSGTTESYGPYVSSSSVGYSSPSRPREGSAAVDSDGYLTYSVKVTAGADNTYPLTNVEVTDLFDADSRSKVDLGSMKLVRVVSDGKNVTSSATPVTDADGNVCGWNIGSLPAGAVATVTYKVKIDKDGITAAVDAAKEEDATTDAAEARTIGNTASATADGADVVSDDYSTTVSNYVTVTKKTATYGYKTQTQHFTITVSAPSDNRYTQHDVPVYDHLEGTPVASYYEGAGIASMTVTHADGTTESLQWGNFSAPTTTSWYATIPEMRPGDVVTIDAYLTLDDSYWTRYAGAGLVGSAISYNRVEVGNLGDDTYASGDLNKVHNSDSFRTLKRVLVKNSPEINSDGTIDWVITGNEQGFSATPTDVGGQTITDTLGPDQVFRAGTAKVTFFNQDGTVAGYDTIQLADGSTSFSYTIPTEYGTCGYTISCRSTITDWETYVGPAKSYTNTVGDYTARTSYRPRVAAMKKSFVEQADDWSSWKTEIYSELQAGDTYTDASRSGVSVMYFTQDDLDAIALTIDGVAVDASLYQVEGVGGTADGRYRSYKVTFKGDVAVTSGGATLRPSVSHPLVVAYRAHMVNPTSGTRTYYNDATLSAGGTTDKDADFCKRSNSREMEKSVYSVSGGNITWTVRTNCSGYSARPDGTCTVTDTLPAGLSYVGIRVTSSEDNGKVESVTPVVNEDGTTTLTIELSGLGHDEVCNAHETDKNYYGYVLTLQLTTRITDPEYLYGATSQTLSYTNTASLTDRYGNTKSASATASVKHAATKKSMAYSAATAPYAQFSIEVNKDRADLNPDGDTVGVVDASSSTLAIDTSSIRVVDGLTGAQVGFTVDATQMADNQLTVNVPDGRYVKITYRAQVLGYVGENVQVDNSAYFGGHKSVSGENSVSERVRVLSSSGAAESEPMVWLAKRDENAAALGGATYRLDRYDEASGQWVAEREGIESSGTSTKGTKVESLQIDVLYRLVETSAPAGYVLDPTPHYFVLYRDEAPTVTYPDGVDAASVFKGPSGSVISVYDRPYTTVRLVKHSDDGVQLAGAEFAVYAVGADGTVASEPAVDESGRSVTFSSEADGYSTFSLAPGTYQLVETKAPDGYATADPVTFVVRGDAERTVVVGDATVQSGKDSVTGGLDVTDATRTTSLEVTKAWDDCSDFDGIRPASATVELLADYGDGQGSVVVSGEDGSPVTATLTAEGPDGQAGTDDDWTASFDGLDVMRAGKVVAYSVREIDPGSGEAVESGTTLSDGYTCSVGKTTGDVAAGTDDAYCVTVTNSYEPRRTSLSVRKEWDDAEDQDGKRPTSVTVQLYADGTAVEGETAELSEEGSWSASFEDLASANDDGSAIVYTVRELDADDGDAPVDYGSATRRGYVPQLTSASYTGYPTGKDPTSGIDASAEADGTDDTGDGQASDSRGIAYAITNVRIPEVVDVSVTKRWVDQDASSRPSSIAVNLLRNGEVVDSAVVEPDEDGEWCCVFEGLDRYEGGEEIAYAVEEAEVPEGYTSEVSGDVEDGFTITNTKEPEAPSADGEGKASASSGRKGARPVPKTGDALGDARAIACATGLAGILAVAAGIVRRRRDDEGGRD